MSHNLFAPTTDFLGVFDGLSAADAAGWERAAQFRQYSDPVIHKHWQASEYPLDLVARLGALDVMTDGLDVPGHEQMSTLGAGLTLMEITRADASMGTVIAVQAGLAALDCDAGLGGAAGFVLAADGVVFAAGRFRPDRAGPWFGLHRAGDHRGARWR